MKLHFNQPRVFFFHYNKPLSKQKGKPQISLHVADTCYFLDNVKVCTNTWGVVRKRQPFFVMKGKTSCVEIEGGVARILR